MAHPLPVKREETLKVCESCPWLTKNHGKPHPAGWYKIANLKRLWNGLRSGRAPGMVCHSSDPKSIDYGSTSKVKDTVKPRDCAGALLVIGKHLQEVNADFEKGDKKLVAYKAKYKFPLTKGGIQGWLGEYLFGRFGNIEDRSKEVSLPWEKTDASGQAPEPSGTPSPSSSCCSQSASASTPQPE